MEPVKIIADDDPRYSAKVLERLSARIALGGTPEHLTTPCIEWTGSRHTAGYGTIKVEGEVKKTNRLVWEAIAGLELPKEIFVCHHCDNPGCMNPHHLFLGTNNDNNQDMFSKGRGVPPPGNPKLTEEKVRDIRTRNMSVKEAAIAYPEVKERNLREVVAGRTWKHVA
jgi:hypothetical protein